MNKTIKIALNSYKNNKIFMAVMLILCLCLVALWDYRSYSVYNCIICCALGVILPYTLFGYVHRPREREFYSSMPVKREEYFLGFCLSGLMTFLTIYLPTGFLSVLMSRFDVILVLKGIVVFFVIFAVTMLAIMLSGSVFSSVITFIILNLLVCEIAVLVLTYIGVDVDAYMHVLEIPIYFFTPVSIVEIFNESPNAASVIAPLIMAAINMVLAFFLHRFRRNDNNSSLAFPKLRYPVQYIAMFMAAFFAANIDSFHQASCLYGFEEKSLNRFVDSIFWSGNTIAYMIVAILVMFIITNMIFEGTPRGAFKKIRHLFIFTVCYALVFVFGVGSLYINLKQTVVPFEPDVMIVAVRRWEEMGVVPTDEDEREYGETVTAAEDDGNDNKVSAVSSVENITWSPDETSVATIGLPADTHTEVEQTTMLPPEFMNEYEKRMENDGRRWTVKRDEDGLHYFREGDPVIYVVRDKDYIDNVCRRVNALEGGYRYDQGYPNILLDSDRSGRENSGKHYDVMNDEISFYTNSYFCDVKLVDLSNKNAEQFFGSLTVNNNFSKYVEYLDYYQFDTFIETQEELDEFVSHSMFSTSMEYGTNNLWNYGLYKDYEDWGLIR